MKKQMIDIAAFHEKFGLTYQGPPRPLGEEMHEFRYGFLMEECKEYHLGYQVSNLELQLDALIDLAYVLFGTAYLHGFTPEQFEEAWNRVHTANMKKVRASDVSESSRGSTLDVVKPEGWEAPDLSDIVGHPV